MPSLRDLLGIENWCRVISATMPLTSLICLKAPRLLLKRALLCLNTALLAFNQVRHEQKSFFFSIAIVSDKRFQLDPSCMCEWQMNDVGSSLTHHSQGSCSGFVSRPSSVNRRSIAGAASSVRPRPGRDAPRSHRTQPRHVAVDRHARAQLSHRKLPGEKTLSDVATSRLTYLLGLHKSTSRSIGQMR